MFILSFRYKVRQFQGVKKTLDIKKKKKRNKTQNKTQKN